jgi:sugar phosphate permease
MLTTGLARLTGGLVLLRIQDKVMVRMSLLALTVTYLILFGVSDPLVAVVIACLAVWFASINFGAIFQIAARSVPPSSLGRLMGVVNTLANLGAILATLLLGWYKEANGSFSGGFGLLGLAGLVAFGLTFSRSWRR